MTSQTLHIPTQEHMHQLGQHLTQYLQGGDVIILSGPLGAGKTTLAQGIGKGLNIQEPIVSPTFTIAREHQGTLPNGQHTTLIHVDAYRLGNTQYEPGQNNLNALLDELESLGLDEELEDPQANSIILMEWGEQMGSALADERIQIRIERPDNPTMATPSSDGTRIVTITTIGERFHNRIPNLQ